VSLSKASTRGSSVVARSLGERTFPEILKTRKGTGACCLMTCRFPTINSISYPQLNFLPSTQFLRSHQTKYNSASSLVSRSYSRQWSATGFQGTLAKLYPASKVSQGTSISAESLRPFALLSGKCLHLSYVGYDGTRDLQSVVHVLLHH
jgi:hypothetical protein